MVKPARAAALLHPQWTSYTRIGSINDLLPVGDDLWVATDGGVLRWNSTERAWETYSAEHGLVGNWVVNTVVVDGEGAPWFGTYSGASRFDGQTWTTYTAEEGLVDNQVHAIAVDGEGALWFGTKGSGLSRFRPE